MTQLELTVAIMIGTAPITILLGGIAFMLKEINRRIAEYGRRQG